MNFTYAPLEYVQTNQARFLRELKDFVRFPSISAQPKHASDVKDCAYWLARHLEQIGLEKVKVIPTLGHPIVYAEWLHRPQSPTLLIYGHYDVQPPEPFEQWHSPPFEPTLKGSKLYGRGTSDNKGQLLIHLKAIEAYLKTKGTLPVNIKCIFEGEEEIGSPNLTRFLVSNRKKLTSNIALLSDTSILAPNRPAITYSLRGGLSLELKVKMGKKDLHSGKFGGAVYNPLQALCEIIAKLHDDFGRIAIPGFYDSVRKWSKSERDYMAQKGYKDAQILQDAQVSRAWGERGYTLYERTTLRPALTINGITGGYQGIGHKAVIPAQASAKLSFRLVPDQDPKEIERLFRRQIAYLTPQGIETSITTNFSARPTLVDRNHPILRRAAMAYYKGFGEKAVFLRSGGSIPIVPHLQNTLGIPTVLMGFALPDDNIHAPNERFHLPNFYNGIKTSIWFLALTLNYQV